LIDYSGTKALFKSVVVVELFPIKVVMEISLKFRDLSGTFAAALYMFLLGALSVSLFLAVFSHQ
jgi:hypothetical protein